MWPRAERAIYYEPKSLVEHGLATASSEATGRRRRAVYSITPSGRRALREWLSQAAVAPPQLECEALLRVLFADRGSKEDLLHTLGTLRDHVDGLKPQITTANAEYLVSAGPFPRQLHLIALSTRFLLDYLRLLEDWASWAQAEVEDWPVTGPAADVPVAYDVFVAGTSFGARSSVDRTPETPGHGE